MNAIKRVWKRAGRWIIGGAVAIGVATAAIVFHDEARAFVQSLLPAKQAAFSTDGMKALKEGREVEVPNRPPN